LAQPSSSRSARIGAAFHQALAFANAGLAAEAEAVLRDALKSEPHHFDALHLLAILRHQQGDNADAVRLVDLALKRNRKTLAGTPPYADAFYNRGTFLLAAEQLDEALASLEQSLALRPDHVDTLLNRCAVLQRLGQLDEALASVERALVAAPGLPQALYNRATLLQALDRPEEALCDFDHVLAAIPDHVDAHLNRGLVLTILHRNEEALASYERAIALRPDYAEAHYNRGNALMNLHRWHEAIAGFDDAIALRPDYAEAWHNRGPILIELGAYGDALASYERAAELGLAQKYLEGVRMHVRMHVCDWSDFDQRCARLLASVRAGELAAKPFELVALPCTPTDQFICATRFAAEEFPPSPAPLWRGERYTHDRIRVAYLSADFHEHATAHLMAGLFESHDRSRFETIALSFGRNREGATRQRLMQAFDRFIDVSDRSDREIAALVREMEIDIAVDLKGFTGESRTGIFALRPAPIQVSYLGYPATMGAPYIDYLIADPFLIPADQQSAYSEKIVYLPDTYQANDRTRPIAAATPSRAEAGLPEQGFVFCSFNSNYKITPDLFDVWMRLLRNVEGSVLWLLQGNLAVPENLRREAAARGIAPDRLVFAPRMKLEEHLARHRLADLFIDTYHCNAHTTASDALWAGLPVLTCASPIFAGRVAGSLLRAIGLPELITHSLGDYETLALELARDPARLTAIRQRLAQNRDTFPLFDAAHLARHIEAAYRGMWERQQRGAAPESFSVG
jgi:predicted O-linked N-acetylglucosamine transferase (SPINDLY family)